MIVATKTANVLSISGGKDSTAMWLYAVKELGLEVTPVFADTGNEHEMTYQYIDYLEREIGPVQRVKANFAEKIAHKRNYVDTKWREEGVLDSIIEAALEVLHPTGNPYLDLCIWKGRFPSRMAQFCTQELKMRPVQDEVYFPLMEQGFHVVSMVGVRADESAVRAKYPEREETAEGIELWRPILNWKVKDVFDCHDRHGIEPNPLYKLGMSRVGCMPCINCQKSELFEIARRFPEVIERIRLWESVVADASKRGASSFFAHDDVAGKNIDEWVDWSKTSRGGRQYDWIKLQEFEEAPSCSSQYGLCE
jgi:3'-phosphoadenosine 5'-phosphosulfate sulfotransferase (PAPS reductase)/FAD synthetase